jgi:hypothetical protein
MKYKFHIISLVMLSWNLCFMIHQEIQSSMHLEWKQYIDEIGFRSLVVIVSHILFGNLEFVGSNP